MTEPAHSSLPAASALLKTIRRILLVGAVLGLSACERNEPVPDPAPAPPAPRTLYDEAPPSVQRAVFDYPALRPADDAVEEQGQRRLRLPRT